MLLTYGSQPVLLAHRLPDPPPLIGAEIEAVTVEYVQICRTLHLSMRREFAQARTLPRFASPLLSRHDNLLQQQLQTRRPVEIVFERRNVVRVFGATVEAVRETAAELDRLVPWTASAVFAVPVEAFKGWVMPTFGGLAKFARSTGTAMRFCVAARLPDLSETNRQLYVLNIIQAHVPGIEIRTMHLGHSEAIHACAWSRFDDLPLPRSLPEE